MSINEKTIREKLWKKATQEFENFKKELLKESKEVIFESAYKIATLENFSDMCEPDCNCLSIKEVKTLLNEKHPIHTLYNFYMDTDSGTVSDLYESIWYRLSELVTQKNEKQKSKKQKDYER